MLDVKMYSDAHHNKKFDTPVKKEDVSSPKFFLSTADSFNNHSQFSLTDAISA